MEAVYKAIRDGAAPVLAGISEEDLNARVKGKHILHYAIERGAAPEVIAALIAAGADVNAPSKYGFAALTWAAMNNDVPLMTMLLAAGANVNQEGHHGDTALEMAGRHGSEAAVTLLLERGATITDGVRGAFAAMPEPIRAMIQAESARRADEAAAAVGNVQPAVPSAVLGRIAGFLKGGRRHRKTRRMRRVRRVRWARKTRQRRGT